MKDMEFLLRGFALLAYGDEYKPSMTGFLNVCSKKFKALNPEGVSYFERLFDSFLNSCSELPPKAFYGRAGKFNISIYDAVFAATCSRACQTGSLVNLKISSGRLNSLKEDQDFVDASQSRTAAKDRVGTRLSKASTLLVG
jgi:hypothetical protein